MEELPLFPLNTVLFPGTPLYLHIFEDRYKRMISLCLENHRPFGVVLIKRGVEALGPLAEPYLIGCTAEITDVQRLQEGRLNITAIGKERFRIESLNKESSPYLIGNIEPYPLANRDPAATDAASRRLRTVLGRYLNTLADSGKSQFTLSELPEKPLDLANLAASVAQVPSDRKQELLASADLLDFIEGVYQIYKRESALLKAMLAVHLQERSSFSQN